MIDVNILYVIVLSIGEHKILPNADNITFLVKKFEDMELVPTSIRVENSPALQLSNSNEDLIVRFLSEKIEIVRISHDREKDIGSFHDFCSIATEIWKRIYEKYKKPVRRVGLATRYLLKEMPQQTLQSAYSKFINPISEFNFDAPRAWNVEVVGRNSFS